MSFSIETIKNRHSVRNYKPDKIVPDKVQQINEKIAELNAEGNLHFQLIEDVGKTYNKLVNRTMGLSSAPSVIACVGPDDDTVEQRIGYYGEKLVLFAQEIGLNTCWAGIFNRNNIDAEIKDGERLVISIAIGYGKDSGKPRKSKTPEQVTEVKGEKPDWFVKGVEMALLAPTAINQQKFMIRLNEDETVDFIDKGGMFSQVDLGIVKCHFEIGAGKEIS
ncbi:MAG: nitroreductase [Lachnospiraceae bacterium]|nr:nitroreductase [Lachnospiraceae bacterium]